MCEHDIGGSGKCSECVVLEIAEESVMPADAVRVSDKDVLVINTDKHKFFWEQCCDCGLVHKTHVRVNGPKLYLRHERRDKPPEPREVCAADIISEAAMARILGRKGGKAKVKKGFADPRVQAKAQAARKRKARDGQNANSELSAAPADKLQCDVGPDGRD